MRDSRTIRVLFVGSLSTATFAVLVFAAYLLWPEWKKYQAVERLLDELRNDDRPIYLTSRDTADELVYQRIREVLDRRAGELAIRPLADLRKSESNLIRFNAVTALGELSSNCPEVIPELVSALSDDEVAVRSTAAYYLGRLGPLAKDAVPKLKAILRMPRYATALDAEILRAVEPTATPLDIAGLRREGGLFIYRETFDPVADERDFLKTVADALWSIDPQAAKPFLRWRVDLNDSSADTP